MREYASYCIIIRHVIQRAQQKLQPIVDGRRENRRGLSKGTASRIAVSPVGKGPDDRVGVLAEREMLGVVIFSVLTHGIPRKLGATEVYTQATSRQVGHQVTILRQLRAFENKILDSHVIVKIFQMNGLARSTAGTALDALENGSGASD